MTLGRWWVNCPRKRRTARQADTCALVNQVKNGLSIHTWPVGHATDSEETIKFSELENIDCMIEKFPLEKANEAYGEWPSALPRGAIEVMTCGLLMPSCQPAADAMLSGRVRFRAVISFDF